jgi:excisionase family DNA binding protein
MSAPFKLREFYTVGQVAALVGTSARYIQKRADSGHIRCTRLPGTEGRLHRRFAHDDLIEWLESVRPNFDHALRTIESFQFPDRMSDEMRELTTAKPRRRGRGHKKAAEAKTIEPADPAH